MDIKTISSIFGVLGFFISIATFILTRVERRKKLLVELYVGDTSEYKEEYASYTDDDYAEVIKIRVTNIGGQAVVINPESFKFIAQDKALLVHHCDWFGLQKIPSPLNCGSSLEVAIHTDSFIDLLGFKNLDQYCNSKDAMKTVVPLYVSVKDHAGSKFFTKNFKYFYFVHSLERVT